MVAPSPSFHVTIGLNSDAVRTQGMDDGRKLRNGKKSGSSEECVDCQESCIIRDRDFIGYGIIPRDLALWRIISSE